MRLTLAEQYGSQDDKDEYHSQYCRQSVQHITPCSPGRISASKAFYKCYSVCITTGRKFRPYPEWRLTLTSILVGVKPCFIYTYMQSGIKSNQDEKEHEFQNCQISTYII